MRRDGTKFLRHGLSSPAFAYSQHERNIAPMMADSWSTFSKFREDELITCQVESTLRCLQRQRAYDVTQLPRMHHGHMVSGSHTMRTGLDRRRHYFDGISRMSCHVILYHICRYAAKRTARDMRFSISLARGTIFTTPTRRRDIAPSALSPASCCAACFACLRRAISPMMPTAQQRSLFKFKLLKEVSHAHDYLIFLISLCL